MTITPSTRLVISAAMLMTTEHPHAMPMIGM
jgi:hypothetical protein